MAKDSRKSLEAVQKYFAHPERTYQSGLCKCSFFDQPKSFEKLFNDQGPELFEALKVAYLVFYANGGKWYTSDIMNWINYWPRDYHPVFNYAAYIRLQNSDVRCMAYNSDAQTPPSVREFVNGFAAMCFHLINNGLIKTPLESTKKLFAHIATMVETFESSWDTWYEYIQSVIVDLKDDVPFRNTINIDASYTDRERGIYNEIVKIYRQKSPWVLPAAFKSSLLMSFNGDDYYMIEDILELLDFQELIMTYNVMPPNPIVLRGLYAPVWVKELVKV